MQKKVDGGEKHRCPQTWIILDSNADNYQSNLFVNNAD